tara:strand:+ start:1761 stop:1982 length:222 start_codon:yes stop_codon:yes gene_type:complete
MLVKYKPTGAKAPTTTKGKMKKINDPFGFTKAINFKKLNDPKVLKELEKIFLKEEKRSDLRKAHDLKGSKKLW